MSSLTLEDIDSVSEADHRDGLGPLAPPMAPPPAWNSQYHNPYGPSQYMPPPPVPPPGYMPPKPPYYAPNMPNNNDTASYVSMPGNHGSAGSVHSSGESAYIKFSAKQCLQQTLALYSEISFLHFPSEYFSSLKAISATLRSILLNCNTFYVKHIHFSVQYT